MLNVFMLADDNAAANAQSLAALVPSVVLGHIGRVVVHAPQETDALRLLTEEAGCSISISGDTAGFFATARASRPGWWLAMRGGQIPMEGWSDEALRHTALRDRAGVMLPARGTQRIIKAKLAALFGQLTTRHHMLVVPPENFVAGKGQQLFCSGRGLLLRTAFES